MCDRCQDSGLIPFQDKEGRVISCASTFCDCPSGKFRRTGRIFKRYGGDLDYVPLEPGPLDDDSPQPAITPKQYQDEMHHIKVEMRDMDNKINLHIDRSRSKFKGDYY